MRVSTLCMGMFAFSEGLLLEIIFGTFWKFVLPPFPTRRLRKTGLQVLKSPGTRSKSRFKLRGTPDFDPIVIEKSAKFDQNQGCPWYGIVFFIEFPDFSAAKTDFFGVYGSEKGGVYIFKFFKKVFLTKVPHGTQTSPYRGYILMYPSKWTFKNKVTKTFSNKIKTNLTD